MAFAYKKKEYENIFEWVENNEKVQCFYCHDQEQSPLGLKLIGDKGICKSCLENFEVGNLSVDRHVIQQINPEFETREETVEWLKQYGEMELVDVIDTGEDEETYIYYFINDRDNYEQFKKNMSGTSGYSLDNDGLKLMQSYTQVEISPIGSIHILY